MNLSDPPRSPKLSIIIVSWNVSGYLRKCLISLNKACEKISSEVIVVDNDSKDSTTSMIGKEFAKVKLIANSTNFGFGKANNQGAKIAKGEYLLFLNPDTIVNRESIEKMIAFLNTHPESGLVGPEQFDGKGKIIFNVSRWSPRGIFEYIFENLLAFFTKKYKIIFNKPYQVPLLNGGCWLTTKMIFNQVGKFNEKLFLYGEEPDFCNRLKKKGWHIWFLRNCHIIHFREKSIGQTKKKSKYFFDSYLKLLKGYK